MKLLFVTLCAVFALAYAEFETPLEVHDAVKAVGNVIYKVRLSEAVGEPGDEDLNQVEDDLRKGFLQVIKETLNDVYRRIKTALDERHRIAEVIREKLNEVKEKLADLRQQYGLETDKAAQVIKAKVKELVQKVRELLAEGKRGYLELMDYVARLKFSDYLRYLREKLLSEETLQRIREYFRNLATNSKLVSAFKELFQHLPLDRIRDLLSRIFTLTGHRQTRSISDLWEKVKDFFNELGLKLKGHYFKLAEFLKAKWDESIQKLKEKYGSIKALAMEVIAHAKELSAETAQEALEFFGLYKDQLGNLWDELKEALKDAAGDLKQGN